MKKFIQKSAIFTIPILSFIFILIIKADGYTDPFYIRFTTPKHKNMILGTSRAAQGLQPFVFNTNLNKNIGNYAFTIGHSPFGKVYYESIKRKHSKEEGGLFIVAIDPWSISSMCSSPNNLDEFRENEQCLNKIKIVDLNPNIFYIVDNFSELINGFISLKEKNMFLHESGWLEVYNIAMDSSSVANRTYNKIKTYRDSSLPKAKFSSVRVKYLVKTIDYLNDYGKVYLIRLPIHKGMMELEEQLMPNFDSNIKEAIDISNGYFDMTIQNDSFEYTDGNHLYKTSGAKVSAEVANWIKTKERAHNNM